MRPRKKRLLFIAPMAITAMLLFVAIGGTVVMRLWNWLVPQLFGLREITFWQALGLLALCRILFGGFGFNGGGCRRSGMRHRMEERCANMTPEERERVRQGVRERFDSATPPGGEGQWR